MNSTSSTPDISALDPADPALRGLYPNANQPGGFRFHIPAIATARSPTNQHTTNSTHTASVTSTNHGPQQSNQIGIGAAAGSGHTGAATTSGANGTTNHVNALANLNIGDTADFQGDHDMSHTGRTSEASDSDPGEDNTRREDDTESISSAELPARSPDRKRKRTTAPTSKRATNRPRQAAPGSRRIAPRKVAAGKEKSAKTTRSALRLESKLFATKAYRDSKGLLPIKQPLKLAESNNHSGTATQKSKRTTLGDPELKALVRLLGDLTPHPNRTYLESMGNTASIDRMITRGLKLSKKDDADNDDADADADADADDNEEQEPVQQPEDGANMNELVPYNGLNVNLPPMSNIHDIFADLTKNALGRGLREFLEALGSGQLKVATLCSGTESPLLALQMIGDSVRDQTNHNLRIEHQFSCEIEPFKQAYIERNFKPAILFRDVLELKNATAHTAFGGEAVVPKGADIMIAGSSCVDYSLLNNKPKEFGASGESYDTLIATLDYAKVHKPLIVILENVLSFPWHSVEQSWQEAGYATQVAFLDSKDFYLPQTRQRGYMIGLRWKARTESQVGLEADDIADSAAHKAALIAVKKWFEVLGNLQRRASSPFTDFILADDDAELRKYSRQAAALIMTNKNVSWERCRAECLSCRSANFLGFKKPVTDWENNGSCIVPDSYDMEWYKKQVERVWDTLDINHLRSILRFYDFSYKSRCIDLSQSCIRENDKKPWGIVGCITASANPYLTYRGGPMVGAEALSLQGIPRERLILNRESSRQLIDLSGNAMTTTVVGSAILAAFISCSEVLVNELKRQNKPLESPTGVGPPISPLKYEPKWCLAQVDLTTDRLLPITMDEIRRLAFASIRLCSCENLILNVSQTFRQCSRCGHTSCDSCGKKPEHHYVRIGPLDGRKDTSAIEFEQLIRKALPPRLAIRDFTSIHKEVASDSHRHFGADYTEAIDAIAGEFCLISIKRDRGWSIIYENQRSRLLLLCERRWDGRILGSEKTEDLASAVSVQWQLYAKPKPELPANSRIREELLHPIARLTCSESLFDGQWELRVIQDQSLTLEVVGEGTAIPSWEKNQGLEDPLFKNRMVWPRMEIRLRGGSPSSTSTILDKVLGIYQWLPKCGTACGSLHVKLNANSPSTGEPMFLFLDQAPIDNASHDSFVFAHQHHRIGLKEVREVLLKVSSSWRPSAADQVSTANCKIPSQWIPVGHLRLEEHAPGDLRNVYLATAETALQVNSTPCDASGLPVLWSEFPMTSQLLRKLDLKTRKRFGLVKDPFSLERLSWLLKTAGYALGSEKWQYIAPTDGIVDRCERCAPKPPPVSWKTVKLRKGEQLRPFEDVEEACNYERNVKAAPEAATAELSYDEQSALVALRVDFNILTLVHKAVAALCESRGSPVLPSTMQWRAVVDYGHDYPVSFPHVQLKNCQGHDPASQPPSFVELRRTNNLHPLLHDYQLKSLHWMIQREEDEKYMWDEQEIVEARAAAMDIRLEAKVTAHRSVLGGVLADDVGYGKTALVVALIDHHFQKTKTEPPPCFRAGFDEMIPLRATLILVPKNLVGQWEKEITKFVGTTYDVLSLTKDNFVQESNVSRLQRAHIIIAAWDLFDDDYFMELARMSRAPHTPVSAGRGFEEWFKMAQKDLKELVKESDGLQPASLEKAWNKLKPQKYRKFIPLSTRNKKGRKTSANTNEEPAPKRTKIQDQGVSNNESKAPRHDYAALHIFLFSRIVVDEFSYIKAKQLPAVTAFQARRRWILSGTPPHNTFAGVSSMAKLIGTTIGVPDDAEVRYQKVKDATEEISGGETLRSYATCHTPHWHKARNDRAIAFLDMFVRQNTTFVQGVQKHYHYEKISLPAPERAQYHEGYLLLVNQGHKMTSKTTAAPPRVTASRRKNTETKPNDSTQEENAPPQQEKKEELTRTGQIVKLINSSQSPEDALITLCSSMPEFAIEPSSDTPYHNAISEKERLVLAGVRDILSELRGAFWLIDKFGDSIEDIPDFHQYLRSVQENRFGDAIVCTLLDLVIAQAEETKAWTVAKSTKDKKPTAIASETALAQYNMRIGSAEQASALNKETRIGDMKLRADSLTHWTFSLINHVRERRFFLQTRSCQTGEEIKCSSCEKSSKEYSDMLIMGRCGHAGHRDCCTGQEGSLWALSHCPDQGCGSNTSQLSTIEASDLTVPVPSDLVRQHGSKMVAITNLLSQLPKGDKTLVFVQFPRVILALRAILTAQRIEFADTTQGKGAAARVDTFKKMESTCNVCVLQLDSVNAAGWNLQAANHVVFVSSFASKTKHEYNSSMTQAIGRAFRLGQEKDVHIYHFLAEKTIDVNILEARTGRVVVEREGGCVLAEPKEAGHQGAFGGLPFLGAVCGAGEDGEEDENEE